LVEEDMFSGEQARMMLVPGDSDSLGHRHKTKFIVFGLLAIPKKQQNEVERREWCKSTSIVWSQPLAAGEPL
jgi:hypothetical protein